jgi:hypothetical protein
MAGTDDLALIDRLQQQVRQVMARVAGHESTAPTNAVGDSDPPPFEPTLNRLRAAGDAIAENADGRLEDAEAALRDLIARAEGLQRLLAATRA